MSTTDIELAKAFESQGYKVHERSLNGPVIQVWQHDRLVLAFPESQVASFYSEVKGVVEKSRISACLAKKAVAARRVKAAFQIPLPFPDRAEVLIEPVNSIQLSSWEQQGLIL